MNKTKIAIIGGGPAGVMCAIKASENPENEIYLFDKGIILHTLIPTGGGRCNLAYSEFNFKELAKYYPRGEKFLYSIFSRFSTKETLDFFEDIGITTYTQDDNRIFPTTNSSKSVKEALMKNLYKNNIKKCFEQIINITKTKEKFVLETVKNSYFFDKVVIATGGKGSGQKLAQQLGHNIKELKPALCSLITKEKYFSNLSGLSLKNINADIFFNNNKIKKLTGDFLFTHKGISGPIVYKISSYCAYLDFSETKPLEINLNLVNKNFEQFDAEFLNELKQNPQKESLTVLSEYIPKNLASILFEKEKIDPKTKSGQLKRTDREKIFKLITSLKLHATKTVNGEEIVMAGGVDLNEIDSKTMESKVVKSLYFCGEVLDIDGLTGGFNLQNCWSTGYIAGSSLL